MTLDSLLPAKATQVDRFISLSIGKSVRDNKPKLEHYTIDQLEDLFSRPVLSDVKEGAYYVAAIFDGRRANESVRQVTGLSLDLDELVENDIEDVKECFSDVAYFAYTTFSHSPARPKWRIFVPYSHPVIPEVHERIASYYQQQLGADPCSNKLSQPMFLPICPPGKRSQFECDSNVDGITFFDPGTLKLPVPLDEDECGWQRDPFKPYDFDSPKVDGQRTEWLTKLIGKLIRLGLNDAEILENVMSANEKNDPPLPKKKIVSTLESIRKGDMIRHADTYDDLGHKRAPFGGFAHSSEAALSDIECAHRAILSFGEGNLIYSGSRFWLWGEKGVWESIDEQRVKRTIHSTFYKTQTKKLTSARVKSIVELIRTEVFSPEGLKPSSEEVINLRNGELHIEDGHWVIRPSSRESHFTTQLPVDFKPGASAPRFKQFLEEVFEGDKDREAKKKVLLQALGYSMLTTCKYETFMILLGSGSNGKSVFLEVVRALLGIKNACAVQPSQMGNQFQRAHLMGKLVNIVTEVPEGHLLHDAELKALSSGELMTAEFKCKDPFDFVPYATCWFGTNHLPATRDFSGALFRRAIIVSFNRCFKDENRDPNLKAKLLQELSGILQMVLKETLDLFKFGKFEEPSSSLEIKKRWSLETDQVAQFVEDVCERKGGKSIESAELYRTYRNWALDNGIRKTLGHNAFSRRISALDGITLTRSSKTRLVDGIAISSDTSSLSDYKAVS